MLPSNIYQITWGETKLLAQYKLKPDGWFEPNLDVILLWIPITKFNILRKAEQECTLLGRVMATNVNQTEHYNNTRDTYTQCKPRARAFSRCSLVCMEVAVRTEPKRAAGHAIAEQNPIIVHNIIHIKTIIISCCATRLQCIKLPIILFIVVMFPNPYSFRSVPVAL